MKKYYDTLGLDVTASIEEVAQAYKELSETWNPQIYQNLPRYRRKAEIKLKEINEAYEQIFASRRSKPTPEEQEADQSDEAVHDDVMPESESAATISEKPIPPQIGSSTQKKTLFYGLTAIALVLGILVFYQLIGRKKPAQPGSQTVATTEEKPGSGMPSPPVSAVPLQKEPEADPADESAVQTQAASTDKQKFTPAANIDYDALLTEETLDRYNQDPARVKRAQKGLIANGYDTGPLDGIIGPYTTAALRQFASDHALEPENLFASNLTDGVLVYAEVAATHPEWHSIIASDDFLNWLKRQSFYQNSRLQNMTAQQVIDTLNRYKSEKQ